MEISTQDILNRIRRFINFHRDNFKYYLIFVLLFLVIFLLYAKFSKPKFEATSSFFINEADKGISSSLLSLAGQSGLLFGTGGVTPTEDKIAFLLQSKRVLGNALLKVVKTRSNQTDQIGDFLIAHLKINFSNEELMDNFTGFKSHNLDSVSLQESFAIDMIIESLIKWKLFSFEIQKKKSLVAQPIGVISIQVTLKDEDLAKHLAESIFEELSYFYIQNATEKQFSNVQIIKAKLDSTESLLKEKEYELGFVAERNLNLIRVSGKTEEYRLKKDVEILNTLRVELIKNFELAKLTLEQQKPFFKVIDNPLFPLKKIEKSLMKFSVLGALAGSFIAFAFLSFMYFRQTKSN